MDASPTSDVSELDSADDGADDDLLGAAPTARGSDTSSVPDGPAFIPPPRTSGVGATAGVRLTASASNSALHRLGPIGLELSKQSRDLSAMQLACERQVRAVRARAREHAQELRARERQLRQLLRQRNEQLDVLKLDLTTVITRLEESESRSVQMDAALAQRGVDQRDVDALRSQLAAAEARIAELSERAGEGAEVRTRFNAVSAELHTVRLERDTALERARALEDALHGVLERKRQTATQYLLLAGRERLGLGFSRWAFHVRLLSGAARTDDLERLERELTDSARALDESRRKEAAAEAAASEKARLAAAWSQYAGISRVATTRLLQLGGGTDAEALRLALLHWGRRATQGLHAVRAWKRMTFAIVDGVRDGRLHARRAKWSRYFRRWFERHSREESVGRAELLALMLAHWRLLVQGGLLRAQCKALDAQRRNLTAETTGAWWTAASSGA